MRAANLFILFFFFPFVLFGVSKRYVGTVKAVGKTANGYFFGPDTSTRVLLENGDRVTVYGRIPMDGDMICACDSCAKANIYLLCD